MKGVTILGATGTIGINTLDVISCHRDKFRIVALTANRNLARFVQQCCEWQPRYAVIAAPEHADELARTLRDRGCQSEVLSGSASLVQVAECDETDYVMAGIVGASGLLPTLAAARAGKRVMLANKESLVMSGKLFMDAVYESGAELLPIDSEHNAVFQCMPSEFGTGFRGAGISRILLTASGGPFRTRPIEDLDRVTPAEACAHPNWVMGRKISVDSATMMNKGLEVIEACWLFNTSQDFVDVVLHPQSVVHSLVEYVDGSVLAQLGNPDMRTPIAYALAWPNRMASGVERLNLLDVARLDFEAADEARFPCLSLARAAIRAGGTAPTVLNAANEVAVQAFLDGVIRFTAIPDVIARALDGVQFQEASTIETILDADQGTRRYLGETIPAVTMK